MPKLAFIIFIFIFHSFAYSQDMKTSTEEIANQVRQREADFAQTMIDRDFDKFSEFVSDEAIFISGKGALHGKNEITEWWKKYYEETEPPFTWKPDLIEVLPSGELALSNGLVYVENKLVSKFSSIWRLENDGIWRVIFDQGYKICQ